MLYNLNILSKLQIQISQDKPPGNLFGDCLLAVCKGQLFLCLEANQYFPGEWTPIGIRLNASEGTGTLITAHRLLMPLSF